MRKIIALSLLIASALFGFSQNLVLNPDFESYGTVPCSWSISPADFNASINNWTDPTQATPDIHSSLISSACSNYTPHSTDPGCNGYQAPHSGNIFGGFYTYVAVNTWREYIQGQLSAPLVVGQQYIVSMYVSLADNNQFTTNNIGIDFTTTITNSGITGEFGYTPIINYTTAITDTANWILISDTITATASWQYFIIGNFFNDANTNIVNFNPGGVWDRTYYYVDDVSVVAINTVPPVAALTASDTTVCPGSCITFTNLSQNATSYQWSFPGGTPSSDSTANPPNICYTTPGTYDVTLTASNSLSGDTAGYSSYIAVYPQATVPTITQVGDTLFSSQGYIAYQWYFGSDTINGATNYYYVVTQNGNYNLIVTDENGCQVGAGIINVISLTPALSKGEGVSVFPNPNSGEFEIQNFWIGENEIVIYSTLGEIVYSEILNTKYKTFNTNLSGGIYLLKISSAEKIFTKMIVIQK